jgi:electron transfer flavoprotein beta subunit
MKIITCIKQVPASSNVLVDPKTGILIRDGFNVKMNPYDLYALELSFMMKEQSNGTVHTVTMGPPSAKDVLYESIYMGADDATLVSDRAFAGADVLATSYTLSQLIKHIKMYDVVICGKQTTDGDTAQVGPEIAEFLNIPHVPYVVEVLEMKEDSLIVRSLYDTHEEIVSVSTPCLLTVEKGGFVPRLPSFNLKKAKKDLNIKTITLKDLSDDNKLHYGLNGSPTQVDEIFPPAKKSGSILINGDTRQVTKKMFEILTKEKFL